MTQTFKACPKPAGGVVSDRVLQVATMFGVGLDERQSTRILPPTTIDLQAGQIVFITGASGSGKSTLLRLLTEQATARDGVRIIPFDRLPADDGVAAAPLIDAVDAGRLSMDRALGLLSMAGLNDAMVMLRQPHQLSDGQRHRYRLAQAMAEAECNPGAGTRLNLLLTDEFTATLDRTTAAALARNVRKWVSRSGLCFVAATTHDDLLEPLEPDVLIEKYLGEGITVTSR